MSSSDSHARYSGALEPTDHLGHSSETAVSSGEPDPMLCHSWAGDGGVATSEPLGPGTLVDGRYRIEALLGSGGMGAVYRATRLEDGLVVALKAMLPRLAQQTNARLRFQREAKAILRLDHPNVVKILDHGELPPHTPYLVMDFLAGSSLREVIESGERIDCERALLITRGVLQGLAHAHERGVVHRDVKPENVFMLDGVTGAEQARLLDLGLAKLVSSDDTSTPYKLTMRGAVFGTPAYMAPEQALGEEVDERADIYATTVMLYELLTGERPFYANDAPALLIMHTRRAPPPLAKRAPFLEPYTQLQSLIDQGMSKPPTRRFQTAAAYIEAIDAALEQLASLRRPAGHTPPANERQSEHETQPSNSIVTQLGSAPGLELPSERSWLSVLLIAIAIALVIALSQLVS